MKKVSRVMNKRLYDYEETRQRVEIAVERLSYRHNTPARSLSQQCTYTLGVVTFDLKYIGLSCALNGIADKAAELGYLLWIKKLDNSGTTRINAVIESLLSRQVDGIIWDVPEIDENSAWSDEIKNLPVPIVFISMEPKPDFSVVSMDSYLGAQLATQHLLEQGCRHIGHIAGPQDWREARLRQQGWRDTLKKAGVQVSDNHWEQGNWSSASGAIAIERLLARFPEMDGVFVANDQMALSVLSEASRRGIKVPNQLAVAGFDGIAESADFCPPLTTISQGPQALGGRAVEYLVEMIQTLQEQKPVVKQFSLIQPTLVIRESSKRI